MKMARGMWYVLCGVVLLVGVWYLVFERGVWLVEKEEDEIDERGVELVVSPAWTKEIEGEYGQKKTRLVIEMDRGLCEERNWCGFEEHKGRFEDVADTVAYAMTLLDDYVAVSMVIQADGSYVPVEAGVKKMAAIENRELVRFVYYNGDKHRFPRHSEGFSRGWGVDPTTGGLVVYFGSEMGETKEYLASAMRGVFKEICGVKIVNKVNNAQADEEINRLWFGGDMSRVDLSPAEGGTLRVVEKYE